MLVIRLARTGRNKYPTYRIVAAESARAATGRFISILGHYNPHTKELVIKKAETEKYLSNGAQPSNTVIKLLQRDGVELPGWVELKTRKRPSKSEPAPEEPKAEAPEVEAASEEAPTEAAVPEVAPAEAEATPEAPAESAAIVAEAETEAKEEAADKDATPTAESENKAADDAQAAEAAAATVATEQASE